jgi:DNA-binding Lrp family transcriptional regulator
MEIKRSPKEIKLDLRDKKIIRYLSEDFRFSRKKLAGMLKISVEVLNYRINRLKKELLVPVVIPNFNQLGLKQYILFINNLSKEKYDELKENDSAFILAELMGKKHYLIYVICKNINEFLEKNLADENFEIHEVIEYHVDNFNPFNLQTKIPELEKKKSTNLDKYDYKILKQVLLSPEISILELNNKTKIDRATISKHLKKLEQENYIMKYRYAIDSYKIGHILYLIEIKCTPKQKKELIRLIKNDKFGGTIYETHNGLIFGYICPTQHDTFNFFEKIKNISLDIEVIINQVGSYNLNKIPKSVIDFLDNHSTISNR